MIRFGVGGHPANLLSWISKPYPCVSQSPTIVSALQSPSVWGVATEMILRAKQRNRIGKSKRRGFFYKLYLATINLPTPLVSSCPGSNDLAGNYIFSCWEYRRPCRVMMLKSRRKSLQC